MAPRASTGYTGSTLYNGKTATSVKYTQHGRGEGIDAYRVDLEMRNHGAVVVRLKGLDGDQMQDAVGLQNAIRINRSADDSGTLSKAGLRMHEGHGPPSLQLPSEQNSIDRDAARSARDEALAAVRGVAPGASRRGVERGAETPAPTAGEPDSKSTDPAETARRQATRDANGEQKDAESPDAKASASAELARRQAIRDALVEQFDVKGNEYRFRDGDRSVAVRETSGGKITSSSNDPRAARAAVQLADAAGHGSIVVRGHADFKREAWIEATARGMEVSGYKAQEVDHEAARRRAAEHVIGEPNVVDPRGIDRGARGPSAAGDRSRAIAGELIEHGAAPYKHDPNEKDSYYVRVQDARGERTVWGKDLERAINDADLAAGDRVVLKSVGRTPVTVTEIERDKFNNPIGERQVQSHLNRWEARHEGRSASVEMPTEGEPEVVRVPPEPSAARRAVEIAATAYTAARTTTVDSAVRLAERLRVGIDDRERSQTLPPVHNPKHVREVEQEIPTP